MTLAPDDLPFLSPSERLQDLRIREMFRDVEKILKGLPTAILESHKAMVNFNAAEDDRDPLRARIALERAAYQFLEASFVCWDARKRIGKANP